MIIFKILANWYRMSCNFLKTYKNKFFFEIQQFIAEKLTINFL